MPAIKRLAGALDVDRVSKQAGDALLNAMTVYMLKIFSTLDGVVRETQDKTLLFRHVQSVYPVIECQHKPCSDDIDECHFLAKAVIERELRANVSTGRVSAGAIGAVMDLIQTHLVAVISASGMIMKNAGRNTLFESDVNVALKNFELCSIIEN